jgi:hypothetical protein
MSIYSSLSKPAKPKKSNHYLDKAEMHAALVDYKEQCDSATAAGLEIPGVSAYLGACFLNIAQGMALKHNFRGYSFVNDMISDGVMVCLKYVRSYDPGRRNVDTGLATSPLSYFTQSCHFAFINRIKLEAKQTRVKRAMIYSADIDSFAVQDDDSNIGAEFRVNLSDFISSLGKDEVEAMTAKKVKAVKEVKGGLEGFM